MQDIERSQTEGAGVVRKLLWVMAVVAALLGGLLYLGLEKSGAEKPASIAALSFGGPFELTRSDGSVLTDKMLAGRPYAIFFGFTRCPDVCPTTLSRLALWRKQLGEDGGKFDIVFVSVDPERDKPAEIGAYVELFGTPIIAATGTEAQLAQIRKGFGVYVKKVPLDPAKPDGDYTIDHTAGIFLMDAHGRLSSIIDHHEAEATALDKLRMLVG
ncbi:MAG: SCO family protein [Sphingorhabdus sp.]|uniref:SCO family protein n=1 Tax=Sphingorhabdus sp. TaxID=1902408 RepID=UPI003C8CBB99